MKSLLTQITEYLLAQSWQIAVLVIVIGLISFLLRNKSAHIRYFLWLIVLAKCLIPPLYTIPVAVLPQPETNGYTTAPTLSESIVVTEDNMPEVAVTESPRPASIESETTYSTTTVDKSVSYDTYTLLAIGWFLGVVALSLYYLINALRTQIWLLKQRKKLPNEYKKKIESFLGSQGVRKIPHIWLLDKISQPFVWGLVRGSIYMPAKLLNEKHEKFHTSLLGHELSHVIHYDALVNSLQIIGQAIFWFHPFVWWANRKIRTEREKCCDEMTIARLNSQPEDYSEAIVEFLAVKYEQTRSVPSLAVAGQVKNIEERIKTMLRPGKKFYKRPSVITIVVLLLVALFTIPIGCALTNRSGAETTIEPAENHYATLHDAVRAGDLAEVQKFIDGGTNINAMNIRGRTPLAVASLEGLKDMVELLISKGADVNAKENDLWTPLIYAVINGNKDIIELLISKGADVNTQTIDGETPLLQAVWEGDKDIINLLLNNGADINLTPGPDKIYPPALHDAVWHEDFDMVRFLYDRGAKSDIKDFAGYTALRYAAAQGQKNMVELFLSEEFDKSGIHMAACAGDLTRVKELIEQGTEVDTKDEKGWTALFWAAGTGQTEVAEFLIDNGADISANDSLGRTLLYQAVQSNAIKLVEFLIGKGVDINAKNNQGDASLTVYVIGATPLHLAAQDGYKDIVELLLTKGADVNTKTEGPMNLIAGATPLHLACQSGNKEIIELLIDEGADVNVENNRGQTPLNLAQQAGNEEIVELLTEYGAEPDTEAATRGGMRRGGVGAELASSPLHEAAAAGDIEQVKLLISQGVEVDIRANRGRTPLHNAAANGHLEVAEFLIENGADVNAKYNGSTPLHLAAGGGHKEIVELLIEKGTDVNVKNALEMTPLHTATMNGRKDIVELLITKEAEINSKANNGLTPLNIATNRGRTEIVELLREHGAEE